MDMAMALGAFYIFGVALQLPCLSLSSLGPTSTLGADTWHDTQLNARATPFGAQHSLGQVRQLYNNNRPTYHMTDVFGTDTKHIMDNTCSDKGSLNIALGYRERPGSSMGYCFKNGQKDQSNNCICGDQQGMGSGFNKCAGNHGNWRRYNMEKNRNLNCRGMHTKCYSVSNHGILGDTYGCNGPNGRNVQGHMWMFYGGNRGMPCHHYGHYGCYGARWIG
jgi:hypothetical protein